MDVVVLPTPPFWFAIAMILPKFAPGPYVPRGTRYNDVSRGTVLRGTSRETPKTHNLRSPQGNRIDSPHAIAWFDFRDSQSSSPNISPILAANRGPFFTTPFVSTQPTTTHPTLP